MFWKKIAGAGGWVLSTGAALFHAVDPTALSGKAATIYVAVGALLAMFGVHPLAQDPPTK